jgi:hypothetical protein
MACEIVDADLAGLRQPFQDPQPDRVGQRLEVQG